MTHIGIWSIRDDGPRRAAKASISLERHLEDWIEKDPDLLQTGLTIVGRQVHLSGVKVDLLAVTPQGQWACIELKPGPLYRETLAQALDYASLVTNLPGEDLIACCNRLDGEKRRTVESMVEQEAESPREIVVMVVGTTVDPGLDRIVQFLSGGYRVPITTTTFDVFRTDDGTQLLVRETVESAQDIGPSPRRRYSVEAIQLLAADRGGRPIFDEALAVGSTLGLYARPWATCVTLNPPFKRNMTLVYLQPAANNGLTIGYSTENLTSLYPLTDEDIAQTIGQTENWATADEQGARQFLGQLRELMSRAETGRQEP